MSRPNNALIVDDEPHVRAYLRLMLKEFGIETTWEARDGAQALAMISMHKPGLVLLDLNLPVLGGIEVLQQMQVLQPGTPVIIVSSQSAMKSVLDTARLGAIGYILKQSPPDEVRRVLHESLDALEADGEDQGAEPETKT